jgi:hypothetical protein
MKPPHERPLWPVYQALENAIRRDREKLQRRVAYGGRKGRSAARKLRLLPEPELSS